MPKNKIGGGKNFKKGKKGANVDTERTLCRKNRGTRNMLL